LPHIYAFQTVIDPADPNFTRLLGIDNSGVIAGYSGDGTIVGNSGFTLVLARHVHGGELPRLGPNPGRRIDGFGETSVSMPTPAG